MNREPAITHHGPFFSPVEPPPSDFVENEVLAAASREQARRDMALMRDLNRADAPPKLNAELLLKKPVLSDDFFARTEALDREIFERSVAIDRERLLKLGRERFDQLIAADQQARTSAQRIIGTRRDLTSFANVYHSLCEVGAIGQVPVPARTTNEQVFGQNRELDQIRSIEGFFDLWKVFRAQPQAIRAISAFHETFETLVFGQSMLEKLSDDSRLRSRFFAGGHGTKVALFRDWLKALHGEHFTIQLTNSLQAMVFWLAGERNEPPDLFDLAREYFNTRVPSRSQISFAQAVFDGFLLGHKGWPLWQYVGRRTQTLPDERALNIYHERLERRFRRVQFFYHELERCFWKAVGSHSELDSAALRRFVDRIVHDLRNCASSLGALAVEDHSPGVITARLDDFLLCESTAKADLADVISEKLESAFRRTAFKVEIEQVQS